MSKEVLKAEVKQPPSHTKTVLSAEDKVSIAKGKQSLARSRAQRERAMAGSVKK
jgi:hypothetical protein